MRKVVLLIVLLIPNLSMDTYSKSDELLELASIVHQHNLEIEQWEVTLTEKISIERAEQIIERLASDNNVNMSEAKASKQYTIQESDTYKNISLNYKIIIPENKNQNSTITAVLKGTGLDDFSIKQYKKVLDVVTRTYFSGNVTRFACLITSNNDIMKGVVFVRDFINELNLTHVLTQTDKISNSRHNKIIYGYKEEWEDKIKIHNQEINVQIVLTDTGDAEEKIIIGTPILINEY